MSHRNARLLAGLSPADLLLEIGPSFNPVAPKREGWQVTIVDHGTREELLAKYASAAIDPSVIEEIDVLWRGGPLDAALQAEARGRYAAVIACHVIEHLPDLIGFLQSAAALVDPARGALLLAVPDKRLCFDIFRPISTTGQVLAAHRAGRQRHTGASLFDAVAYGATAAGRTGWGQERLAGMRLEHALDQAWAMAEAAESEESYVDCHAWQFTPASFELLILELGALGLIDWQLDWLEPQPAVEFLARLRRGRPTLAPEEREARRLALLYRRAEELRAMTDLLLGVAPPAVLTAERLAAIEAGLREVAGAQLPALAAGLGAVREELRPLRSALDALLPVRKVIARLRGRG